MADGGAVAGSEWPSAAVEASQQPGRDTKLMNKTKFIWLHDAHERPGNVFAAKKLNLA